MESIYLNSKLQKINNNICSLFQRSLFDDSEEGSFAARKYLLKDRKITKKLIEKFRIGWYPPNRFVSDKSPVLSGRVIFPIFDEYGDVRAFSGRKIKHQKKDRFPKYFHEKYPKSFFLYGLNLAWRHILFNNAVILTEGQIDTIMCYGCGLYNTVSIMGSHLKYESFIKLNRFCDRYILLFDYDEGGLKCLKKTIELIKSHEKKYVAVKLKTNDGGFDPSDFVIKYGKNGLVKTILYFIKKNGWR